MVLQGKEIQPHTTVNEEVGKQKKINAKDRENYDENCLQSDSAQTKLNTPERRDVENSVVSDYHLERIEKSIDENCSGDIFSEPEIEGNYFNEYQSEDKIIASKNDVNTITNQLDIVEIN